MEKKKDNKNKIPNIPGKNSGSPLKKPKFNFYWIYGILLLVFIGLQFMYSGETSKKTNWGELKQMLKDGDVKRIVLVNKEFAEIYINLINWDMVSIKI